LRSNRCGATALHAAANSGSTTCLAVLVSAGLPRSRPRGAPAQPPTERWKLLLESHDRKGMAPIHLAVLKGSAVAGERRDPRGGEKERLREQR
jgi:hypothetical protein